MAELIVPMIFALLLNILGGGLIVKGLFNFSFNPSYKAIDAMNIVARIAKEDISDKDGELTLLKLAKGIEKLNSQSIILQETNKARISFSRKYARWGLSFFFVGFLLQMIIILISYY